MATTLRRMAHNHALMNHQTAELKEKEHTYKKGLKLTLMYTTYKENRQCNINLVTCITKTFMIRNC